MQDIPGGGDTDINQLFQLSVPLIWPDIFSFDDIRWRYWIQIQDTADEATDFPICKPDIDVFYPIHSRTSRGWYHIQRCLRRQPIIISANHKFPTTAASLPPELFEHILKVLQIGSPDLKSINVVFFSRRELGACALVCRYWARICQERLFSSLRVNSREDLHNLMQLLKSPVSRISSYITCFNAQAHSITAVPWIHHFSVIHPRLPNFQRINIFITGPLPPGQSSFRSLHGGLPICIPSIFSRNITHVVLSDIHFRRFDDLAHLVGELLDLEDLQCKTLTWGPDSLTAYPPSRPLHAAPKLSRRITMSGCTSAWVSVWLLGLRQRGRQISSAELPQIGALTRHIANLADAADLCSVCETNAVNAVRDMNASDRAFSLDNFNIKYRILSAVSFLPAPGVPQLYLAIGDQQNGTSTAGGLGLKRSLLHVRRVAVDFPPLTGGDCWRKIGWAVLLENLRSLEHLQMLILGFQSREDMSHFVTEIADAQLMGVLGKLEVNYAVRKGNKNDGTWFCARPESDEMTNSFFRDLTNAYPWPTPQRRQFPAHFEVEASFTLEPIRAGELVMHSLDLSDILMRLLGQ